MSGLGWLARLATRSALTFGLPAPEPDTGGVRNSTDEGPRLAIFVGEGLPCNREGMEDLQPLQSKIVIKAVHHNDSRNECASGYELDLTTAKLYKHIPNVILRYPYLVVNSQ